MKRKQAAASLSDPPAKKRKQKRHHRDLDTIPLSPAATATATPSPSWTARVYSFHSCVASEFESELKPKFYCAQSRRQSDSWNSSG
jgi:hypothetical protein